MTKRGGVVAACVWDHAGRRSPLSVFWDAVGDLDPDVHDESELPGARRGHLVELFDRAGLADVADSELTVTAEFADVDAWLRPFTLGVGPAGSYVATLDPARRERLRERCAELLATGPFTVAATVWTVLAHA